MDGEAGGKLDGEDGGCEADDGETDGVEANCAGLSSGVAEAPKLCAGSVRACAELGLSDGSPVISDDALFRGEASSPCCCNVFDVVPVADSVLCLSFSAVAILVGAAASPSSSCCS